ncbi:thyroglobulin [Neolamprologus brichardi]|uniref:thyroglobulin n=1 Tax=Neolamprologus brichardi TaxID=32507 RepID=UPI001643D306|nr:thyroglobulin [Neolamprologus brichardi]
MARLLRIACILVCCPALLQGKASEYQLESETLSRCELLRGVAVAKEQDEIPHCAEGGRFRPVQCSGRGQECWCVDTEGQEVTGTRTNGSAPHYFGNDASIRARKDQEAGAGFPEAFETFSSFRKFFPLVSSYCFCSDSRGRELENTGVELLLSEVYDSAFSGLRSGHSFSQTNIYRVLQRRMLGVRLALTGRFRCPSPCEEERRAAMEANSVFIPSCENGGAFTSKQCQQGGQCWCVDPAGRELPGTRQHGDSLTCSSGPADCRSQRRLALSRLFSGPVEPPFQASSGSPPASCLSLLQPLRDLLPVDSDPTSFLSQLVEVLHGLFPSVGGALQALTRSSPRRFQENLFGGKFLKNAAAFNFSGAVGSRGALSLDPASSQTLAVRLQRNQDLVQSVSRALEDPAFLSTLQQTLTGLSSSQSASVEQVLAALLRSCSADDDDDLAAIFVPSCTQSGAFQEVQCQGAECWCVDPQGREVKGSRTVTRRPRCPSPCERARAAALEVRSNMVASAEIHIPACSRDGDFLPLQCVGSRCFCVDAEGKTMTAGPAGGAVTCPERKAETLRSSAGRCSQALAEVETFRQEVKSIVALSNSSHIPLGYGFLLAEGLRLTREELQISQSEEELQVSETLLRRPGAALRLAAFSTVQMLLPRQRRSYQPFTPQCDADGRWLLTQCYHSTGQCWCVDEDGQYISDSLTSRSLSLPKCLTRCQRAKARSLLSGWMKGSDITTSSPYHPTCEQLPSSGRAVSLCDDSSVTLQCDGDDSLRLTVRWSAALYDLPTSDLPDLHDVGLFLNESRLLEGLQGILRSVLSSEPKLVSVTTPSFGCSRGYHLDSDSEGCVVCPAGSFSQEGVCHLCLQGTYQDEEGRDFCNKCPTGSSPAGASSVKECVTECQRRGLRCSQRGDFLPAQPDVLAGRWRCFNSEGVELEWSSSEKLLTDDECSVLSRFQAVPTSDLIVGAADAEVLQTMTSDLTACVRACAAQPSCHHVALINSQTQCELYSTHSLNTHCNTSQQSSGFLAQAEMFDSLSCYLRVRGGASDLLVIRKKGAEFSSQQQQQHRFVRMRMMKAVSGVFRTQVFSSRRTSLSDAHRFCQDGCSRDTCCDGFILNQNSLEGGSLLCGWLRAPSVLTCGDQDWDVIGQGAAERICGAGLTYNVQEGNFLFDFGGQKFTIADSALPADSKNRKDYQSSVVSFQAIYLNTASAVGGSGSSSCAAAELSPPLDASVQLKFASLSEDDVVVDPQRKLPALSFWLNKNNYNSQQAQLWCLTRCNEEPQCSVADLRDADSAGFFSCSLYPDSRVCGAYDKPLRRPCSLLLDRAPNNTYSKKVDLSGPVKSFYERVSFKKMVSNSVRSQVTLGENTPLSEGFMECERRCDEDPCCRGVGFVRYSKSRVNQWSSSPALCPPFSLPPTRTNISLDDWSLLADSSVLVDPSLSTYDVIHVSRDIAGDRDKTRDWCLHACQEAESCAAVSLSEVESATRCVLYPDTTVCGLSSAPESPASSSCRLVVREPAPQVYLRRGVFSELSRTSVSIPGQGVLQGVAVETALASDRRTVIQFLGVPYARPPIGSLRFEAAQPAEWTGTWDATKPRASCIQPGDAASAASSEDCLHLNIFTPADLRGRAPVLLFFFNPSANENPGLLDGSILAAMGNIVVVTASYRTAALGFLSTGESGLRGNYGLSDQEAALRWVKDHISLMGGDNSRVTVGAERGGADVTSLHLLSSSRPLFQRMMLMGGSAFSPSLVQADVFLPLDVQLAFGTPHHPMSSQRFTSSDRRLSLAMMTYVSSFIRSGNPNPSRSWAESVLPRWQPVLSSEAPPTYLELSTNLHHQRGLSQSSCSFWTQLAPKLTSLTGASGAEPVQPALMTSSPA